MGTLKKHRTPATTAAVKKKKTAQIVVHRRKQPAGIGKPVKEVGYQRTATGAIIGGIVGMIGGPLLAVSGALIGGLIGNTQDLNEDK